MASIRQRGTKDGVPLWTLTVFTGWGPDPKRPGQLKKLTRSESFVGTKKQAKTRAGELEKAKARGVLPAIRHTVSDLLDWLIRDYEVNGKGLTWCKGIVENHLRPAFGTLLAEKLTTDRIVAFQSEKQESGAAASSINQWLCLLRRAFNLARRANKVQDVPFFPMLKVENTRLGFFEREEYVALRDNLPDPLKPVLATAFYTGMRRGEVLGLRWNQIDLRTKMIRLNPNETKSGYGRQAPMSDELHKMLTLQKQRRDAAFPHCEWVFFDDAGQRIGNFRKAWATACKAAGLWIPDPDDAERGEPSKLFHDLRRSGVRNLIRAGVSQHVAMSISGHRTESVFRRYNVVAEGDLRDAARKLNEYLNPAPEPNPAQIPNGFRKQEVQGVVQ